MYCDYDKYATLDDMVNTILEHLVTNTDYNKGFTTGDIVRDAERYFKL